MAPLDSPTLFPIAQNGPAAYSPDLWESACAFAMKVLAGRVAPSTAGQYAREFAHFALFAGSAERMLMPEVYARWAKVLLETGYTLKEGTQKDYTASALSRKLTSVRMVLRQAAVEGYVEHGVADSFLNTA